MWTIPYLVSVLCMQRIARDKKELSFEDEDEEEKWRLETNVELWEGKIEDNKERIEEIDRALSLEREALQGLLPSSPGK